MCFVYFYTSLPDFTKVRSNFFSPIKELKANIIKHKKTFRNYFSEGFLFQLINT